MIDNDSDARGFKVRKNSRKPGCTDVKMNVPVQIDDPLKEASILFGIDLRNRRE